MIEVTKAEAAQLTDALDDVSLRAVLEAVLNRLVERRGESALDVWSQAGRLGGWSAARIDSIAAGRIDALQRLAVDLSELRTLEVDR